jgi:hypothetical protein
MPHISSGIRCLINKTILALLITPLFGSLLCASEKYDVSRLGRETGEFIRQPLKWQKGDYFRLGLVTAGTILVMPSDQSTRDKARGDSSYDNSFVVVGGRVWGEWYSAPVIAGVFALNGWAGKKDESTRIGFELIQASIYSASITSLLKAGFGRARPYVNDGATAYKPFNMDADYNSFPSGHVTSAFTISTVLAKHVDSGLLKILIYTPAVATAVSRVYQDQHWASDCVFGAAIGYYCGAWVVDHHGLDKSAFKITSIYPPSVSLAF